jgi:hypothetical protein
MSSVNLAGASQGLYQFLQNVSSDISNATSPANSSNTFNPAQALSQQLSGTHHHRHHGNGFMQEIQQAVTKALGSSQNNGSTDPNQVVQNAIASVLNGNSSGAESDGDNDGSGATDASGSPRPISSSTFLSTLQSYGISPTQFRQDFLAALQNVQGSQANPTATLQNVPPGLTVDTLG